VTTTGTVAAEILIGGVGDDTLTGGGGLDSFRGGAGDDQITIPDLASLRSIDGGSGTDTLKLAGTNGNDSFDFTALANSKVQGIEAINFAGGGSDTLTLRVNDILNLSDTPNADFTGAALGNSLVVTGDADDTIIFDNNSGFSSQTNRNLDGTSGGDYIFFTIDGMASVAVHRDIGNVFFV
jgi:hypothetical protein